MSLSEKLCLRSDSQKRQSFSDCFLNEFQSKDDKYRRDSFDDRFCDDLSEVLLQFLPIKDKLKLECVSKQFQRTIFQNISELNLDDSDVCLSQILKTFSHSESLKDSIVIKNLSILRLLILNQIRDKYYSN